MKFELSYVILTRMLSKYELTLILKTSLKEEEQKKVFEEVKKILGKEGNVKETRDLGKRVLSYQIKKEKEGNYFLLTLESMADNIVKLAGNLRLKEEIIRFLIVRS